METRIAVMKEGILMKLNELATNDFQGSYLHVWSKRYDRDFSGFGG